MPKIICITLTVLLIVTMTAIAQQKVLNLYGSAEPRIVEHLAIGFEKESGSKVNWTTMSSAETLARLRAQSSNPQADVWWGGTLEPHLIAAREGLTVPYRPTRFNELYPQFRDPIGGYQVIGAYVGVIGFSVNETVLKKMGLPSPEGWKDLLDPRYKGLIGVANPNTSITALTTLATQIFLWGENEAFNYMKRLHKNIAYYTISGVTPDILAGRGEIAIAIIFLHDSVYHTEQGYPVTQVVPCEGTGYEIGGLSLIKGAPNPKLAKQFIDWVLAAEVQESLADFGFYQLPTNIKLKVPELSIAIDSVNTVDYYFKWVADNSIRIKYRWTQEVFKISR